MALTRNTYQRNSTWNAPYTFSGKEKDAETGYGYFGARYYDSGLSIWLSVDPRSDDFPGWSPYNYCFNNPKVYTDPDGEGPIGAVIGFVVGGLVELGSQTVTLGISNWNNNKSFFYGWDKNVDWADVGISATVGALDGFLPGSGQLVRAIGGDVLKSSIDWYGGKNFRMIGYNKPLIECGTDLLGNLASTFSGKLVGSPTFNRSNLKWDGIQENLIEIFGKSYLKGLYNYPILIGNNYLTNLYYENSNMKYVILPEVTISAPRYEGDDYIKKNDRTMRNYRKRNKLN
jgi:RHS repeat-associated protein